MKDSKYSEKVIFKTKNGRVRSVVLSELCDVFLKFHQSLDHKDPTSYQFIPLIKNYEKAIRVMTNHKPDLIEKVLKVECEPEDGVFENEFLKEPSLTIKFPKEEK